MMFVYWISLLLFLKIGFISDVYSKAVRKDTELSLNASQQLRQKNSLTPAKKTQASQCSNQEDEKQEKNPMNLIEDEQEIQRLIQEIERYMKGLRTLSCRFKQTNIETYSQKELDQIKQTNIENHPQKETNQINQTDIENHPRKETHQDGKIIMDKSKDGHYKIRIDFLNSSQTILLIDGKLAIFDVKEGKIVSKANLSSTPISYVFSNQLDIKRQFKSISLWEIPSQKMVFIKLQERKNQSSDIILYFKLYNNGNVYHLMGWTLCDSHKILTEVSFDSGSLIVNDPKIVKDPKIFDPENLLKAKKK